MRLDPSARTGSYVCPSARLVTGGVLSVLLAQWVEDARAVEAGLTVVEQRGANLVAAHSGLLAAVTTVNWEREPGEKIEEFVAALLLLEHPHGNLITPSRGDRGVDIRVWHPDGFDIYQVKRYTRPLTSRQVTEVENSWSTFVRETLPVLPVRSWTLVTPWNPTNDRLDWLDQLTTGAGIPCRWMGRTNLDVMAAQRPSLIDYYFGDGGQRLQRLIADALQGGRDLPPGVPAEDMLAAAVARQRSIVVSLNELDPFYRYELDIRTGALRDQPWDADTRGPVQVAYVRYNQLDDDHYSVLRLVPLSAESLKLRPITVAARLEVSSGSPEHQAVEDFLQFGAPFNDVPGTVTEVSGPPGIATSTAGQGLFRFMIASESAASLPDLEVRLLAADGSVLHTVGDRRRSAGGGGPRALTPPRSAGGRPATHLRPHHSAGCQHDPTRGTGGDPARRPPPTGRTDRGDLVGSPPDGGLAGPHAQRRRRVHPRRHISDDRPTKRQRGHVGHAPARPVLLSPPRGPDPAVIRPGRRHPSPGARLDRSCHHRRSVS